MNCDTDVAFHVVENRSAREFDWLYSSGSAGRGTLLLVISIVALTLDNVLRLILIKKGADLPLVLILSGVIAGVIGFGVIGLFIGPVLLAVT